MKRFLLLFIIFLTGCSSLTYLDYYTPTTFDEYNEEYNLENNVFTSISYNEFMNKMDNKETFVFYFGGSWCLNCRTVASLITEVGLSNNISIYNLDPRNNNKDTIDDFRKCNNEEQELLYKEFIEKLNYKNDITVLVEDEYGNIRDTNIAYLAVPSLFAIKDGVVQYYLIEEYTELNDEIIYYYKNELQTLINKTHH